MSKGLVVGIGEIWNATQNVPLATLAEVAVNYGMENIEVPVGSAFSNFNIPTNQPISGSFGFRSLSSGVLKVMSGGTIQEPSVSIPGYVQVTETVAALNDVCTLSQQPASYNGNPFMEVSEVGVGPLVVTEGAGAPLAVGTADYTDTTDLEVAFFVTGYADGTLFNIKYWVENPANAVYDQDIIVVNPLVIPTAEEYMVSMKFYDTYADELSAEGAVFWFKKLQRVDDAGPWGASVGDVGSFTMNWSARNEVYGDVVTMLIKDTSITVP